MPLSMIKYDFTLFAVSHRCGFFKRSFSSNSDVYAKNKKNVRVKSGKRLIAH